MTNFTREELLSFLDNTSEGISIHDKGRMLYVNRALADLFGYEPEELVGRNAMEFADPGVVEQMKGGLPDQGEASYSLAGIRRNGKRFDLEIRSRPIEAQGRPLRIATCRDVTAERAAERRIRESNELFQSTFDHAAVGIVHTAPDGRCIRANSKFSELVGRPVSEILKGDYRTYLLRDDWEASSRGYQDVLEGRASSYSAEVRLVRAGGETLWVLLTSSVVRDPRGEVKYFVTITQDIAGKKLAEARLLDHRMRLFAASRMSALGVMASGIAHEVNNPLSVIRAYASVLREALGGGKGLLAPTAAPTAAMSTQDELLGAVERIDATAVRITRIVRSLMGVARDPERDPLVTVPVSAIVSDAMGLCELRVSERGVEFLADPVPEGLSVECRSVEISQIMLNLLNNAIDAVEAAPSKWVRIQAADLGDQIEIAIVDSGPGVPPEVRGRIMQPFFTTKGDGKGTGLGLNISRKIAEGHSGTITLDADAEHTRFVVRLPKRQRRP